MIEREMPSRHRSTVIKLVAIRPDLQRQPNLAPPAPPDADQQRRSEAVQRPARDRSRPRRGAATRHRDSSERRRVERLVVWEPVGTGAATEATSIVVIGQGDRPARTSRGREGNAMALNKDIVTLVKQNRWFREVVMTGPRAQVVVMNIPPGGEIGEEVHDAVDQVLVFVDGEGSAIIEGERTAVGPGRLVLVPAGTRHNFINTGPQDLRLYTVYTPPQHAQGTIHRTKAEADADEHDHAAAPAALG
jgi:mannose-6-phosphate isomerase-like protein (cupin superfamily)